MQAIQLKELKKIALLGAGAFGQVFLVKHNIKYYALKCLSKALVLETGLQVLPCSAQFEASACLQSFQSPWIKTLWVSMPFLRVSHRPAQVYDNSRFNCSRVNLCVCLPVCLSVCLWHVHSPVCLTVLFVHLCICL